MNIVTYIRNDFDKKNDFVLFKMQLKKDSIFTDPVQHYMCQELKI